MSARAEDLALRAAEHLTACGQRAVARGDAAGATKLLSRALELLDAVPERVPAESRNMARWVLFLRGQALGRLGDVRHGRIDLETALREARHASDRSLEMNATNELGFLLAGAADYREAVPLLEQSLRLAETAGDHEGQVNALARLSIVDTNRLRLDLALERAHRAHELAREHGDPRSLAMALDALEVASVMVGDMAEVDRIAPQLVELHHRRGDPWYQQFAIFQWSWVPLAAARWEEAASRVEEAWAINREIGDRGNEALYPATLGWIARATGDYGRALEYGRRGVELAEAADHIEFIAWAAGILGWTYEELFATDDAVAVLTHSLKSAEHAGALVELPRAVGHLAFLRCNQGAESETRALIGRGDEVLAHVTTPSGKAFLQTADGAIALARAHAFVGQRADAEAILTDVSMAADAAGWQELRASAALALGTPPLEWNRSCIERALRIADASRLQGVGWRANAALAGILDRIEADRHLASAKEAVAKLASTIEDSRIGQAFEAGASEQIDRAMGSS
jgi:tetratricopeptide (TPR) repeat protein